jgi:hypothetical protein
MEALQNIVQGALADMRMNLKYITDELPSLNVLEEHKVEVKKFFDHADFEFGSVSGCWSYFIRDYEEAPDIDQNERQRLLRSLNYTLRCELQEVDALVRTYQAKSSENGDYSRLSILLADSATNILNGYAQIYDSFLIFMKLCQCTF